MEVEFEVKMKSSDLYDYMLFHTYSGLSGIVGTIIGILLIVNFFFSGAVISVIFGAIILLYLPWTLFLKAQMQMQHTPAFQNPLHYKMTEEGIEISQGEEIQRQAWTDMTKAVSTRNSIIVYTSKINASIFPRRDLGEKTAAVVESISVHMPPNKVKIKA